MAKKLTMKERLQNAFMMWCDYKSFVDRVLDYARDYDCPELLGMAKRAKSEVENYREKIA